MIKPIEKNRKTYFSIPSFDCLFKIDFFHGLPGVGVVGSDLTGRSVKTSVFESSKRILAADELLAPVTELVVPDILSEFQGSSMQFPC